MRIVLDTNLYISYLFSRKGRVGELFEVVQPHELLISDVLYEEVLRVVSKPKVLRYVHDEDVLALVNLVRSRTRIEIQSIITDCRDPKDNHILALALDGKADLIVTGDDDLLVLHPWRNIPILNAADALVRLG